MNFLIDTNVISEPRRKRPAPGVLTWFERVDIDTLHLSVLTVGALANGVARMARRDGAQAIALQQWLDHTLLNYRARIIPVDVAVASAWGALNARRPLPTVDGLLAATAVVHGLTLVTRNVRDFAGTDVQLLNPWGD